ncbi:MAG: fasciclin domain-containing protein [Bacteroidia bacterium]
MKHRFFQTLTMVAIFSFAILFTACEDDDTPDPTPKNLVEIAQEQGFAQLAAALTEAGLVDVIATTDNLTVFAPTDAAFDKFLSDNNFADFTAVPDALLENTLKYHVLGQKVLSSAITDGYVGTLDASGPAGTTIDLLITTEGGVKLNGDIPVKTPDVEASNGVIHVIETVLNRPSVVGIASNNSSFSTLVDAVVKAELATTLSGEGPFTVFAPTNAAFDSLFKALNVDGIADLTKEQLTPILLNHVLDGNIREDAVVDLITGGTTSVTTKNETAISLKIMDGKVMINDNTTVTATNVQGVNGVVHVIDKVLVP